MPPLNMPRRKPLQRATISELACGIATEATSDVNKKILDRIQKCLNRAFHRNASEAEAKTAIFISQKLMSEHNVAQADLLAHESAHRNKAHHGGQSKVRIHKVRGSSPRVQREAFAYKLARVMCIFFDCNAFSIYYGTRITWTFYGIANNTVAAAMAFEAVHNLILDWSMDYKGGSSIFNYQLGVVNGLKEMAKRDKEAEMEEAKRKETEGVESEEASEAQPQTINTEEAESYRGFKYRNRSAIWTREDWTRDEYDQNYDESYDEDCDEDCDESSDDDDEYIIEGDKSEIKADFNVNDLRLIDLCSDDEMNKTIDKLMKREQSEQPHPSTLSAFSADPNNPVKEEPETTKLSKPFWKSETELVRFRQTAKQVADDYMAQRNIEVSKPTKQRSNIGDKESYCQGRRDSAKINVRQKKICN